MLLWVNICYLSAEVRDCFAWAEALPLAARPCHRPGLRLVCPSDIIPVVLKFSALSSGFTHSIVVTTPGW